MQNLPWEKSNNNHFADSRMVFQKGPSGGSVEKPDSAEWKNVDAMAKFEKDHKKTIESLAYNANTDDPLKYAKGIRASLNTYLNEGNSMEDLWKYLEQNNCEYLVIAKGLLNFYTKEKKLIKIDNLFTLFYPAQSQEETVASLTKKDGYEDVWEKTKLELKALQLDIEANQNKQA